MLRVIEPIAFQSPEYIFQSKLGEWKQFNCSLQLSNCTSIKAREESFSVLPMRKQVDALLALSSAFCCSSKHSLENWNFEVYSNCKASDAKGHAAFMFHFLISAVDLHRQVESSSLNEVDRKTFRETLRLSAISFFICCFTDHSTEQCEICYYA